MLPFVKGRAGGIKIGCRKNDPRDGSSSTLEGKEDGVAKLIFGLQVWTVVTVRLLTFGEAKNVYYYFKNNIRS